MTNELKKPGCGLSHWSTEASRREDNEIRIRWSNSSESYNWQFMMNHVQYVDVVVKDDPTNVTVDPPDPNIWKQAAPEFETLLQTKESVKCEVKSVMKVYVKK